MGEQGAGVDYAAVLADLDMKIAALENVKKAIQGMANTGPIEGSSVSSTHHAHGGARQFHIQSDAFFSMTVVDAAIKYLNMTGKEPKTIADIQAALKKGGLPVIPGTVSALVSRRAKNAGDVVKVGKDKWGLAEWYPGTARKVKARAAVTEKADPVEEAAKADEKK